MTSFSEFLTDFDPQTDDEMSFVHRDSQLNASNNERSETIGSQRSLLNTLPDSPYSRPAMMSIERRPKPVRAGEVTYSQLTYRKPQESDFDTFAPETPPASLRAVFKMNDVIPNQSNHQRPRATLDTLVPDILQLHHEMNPLLHYIAVLWR